MRRIKLGSSTFDHMGRDVTGDDSTDVRMSALGATALGDIGLFNGAVERVAPAARVATSSLPNTGAATLLINDTADHVINAVESTSVSFNVSGIAGGSTGAVTFTDSGDHHVARYYSR